MDQSPSSMDHCLRPREKKISFSGFTQSEIEKMEKLLNESGKNVLDKEFCQNIARRFCRSSGRAGKPTVKWTEVQSWFKSQKQDSANVQKSVPELARDSPPVKELKSSEIHKEKKNPDLTKLEYEARSSKDGAWYDVEFFIAHRFLSTSEPEVRVRYAGFGAEEDEWVNIKRAVRERSIPLEHSECHKLKIGDLVLCFQERKDGARYFDGHILEIQRRMHDIRGCRCVFLIRFDHDDSKESVHLERLCHITS